MLSIHDISSPAVEKMKEKAAKLFIEQQDEMGAWDFYIKKQQSPHYTMELPEYDARFYFPDLDDTACISRFLSTNNYSARENHKLLQETKEGNLYLTFLKGFQPPAPHRDYIDPVVNANVLLYLQQEDMSVCKYINDSVRDSRASMYYQDRFIYYYMIGRAFKGGVRCLAPSKDPILSFISARRQPNGSYGSALQTAAAVNLLMFFEAPKTEKLEQSLRRLIEIQKTGGEWESGFYFGGPILGYGSEEITTAMAAEALDSYLKR
jgi:hypothetical protein